MHYSVMLEESLQGLNLKNDGVYVDCTLGYGGHSSEILKRVKRGFLFAFDQDAEAIEYSSKKLSEISSNFEIIKSNFEYISEELNKRNIFKVDGILYDLGVSSPQLDEDERGFSYHHDAPLDMRMDKDKDFSAYNVVNEYSEKDLADIIFKYGEDKHAKAIAHNIVMRRSLKPIKTTLELAEIIKESYPYKERLLKHPARKTFQAIRMEVNHELDVLETSLRHALDLLNIHGRIVVITFHSLEDRMVKNIFKEVTTVDKMVRGLPNIPEEYEAKYKLINQKVILPSDKELNENNRSRSSKLRIIERIK